MNDWYGNFTDGQSVKMTFNSYLLATGASATITDLIASDVLVSKDGVSQTTQGAGVTVEIDKNATGAHFITIDTSDTTDAGFYDVGADYQVEFIGATIDTATVNSVVGSFSIENRSDVVDLVSILGTALTETPGQLAAAFKKLFDVAVPTLVASDVMRGTDDGATSAKQDTMETTLDDVPNTAEFEARTIVSADYLIESDTLARVTLVDTVTTNTDKNTLAATDIVSNGPIATDVGAVSVVDTVTDGAKDSTVAKDATVSKESTAAKDATVAKESTLAGVATQTTRVDGLIEDSSGDRYTAKALEEAPSGGGGGDATEAKQDEIIATLGTPADIDGGGATVSDNIKKIADDNGGADFDASTDSLEKIRGAISGGGGTPGIS
jgi:hypothetical protein